MNPQARAQDTRQGPEIRDEMALLNRFRDEIDQLDDEGRQIVACLMRQPIAEVARRQWESHESSRQMERFLRHMGRTLPIVKSPTNRGARKLKVERRTRVQREMRALTAAQRRAEEAGL